MERVGYREQIDTS